MENQDTKDIKASLAGDKYAYQRLVCKYQGRISHFMWRFTRKPQEVEILVQDVFVEAYFSLKTYRADAPFWNWLATIATRTGYKFWKKQKSRSRQLNFQNWEVIENPKKQKLDPSVAADILHNLLAQLKASERLVLTLMYLENLSTEQIAKQTGWTSSAVKMRAMRARKKLKKIAFRDNLLEKLQWTE